MFLQGLSAKLKQWHDALLQNEQVSEPIPADFDMPGALTRLAYVDGVIDNLIDEYDRKQTKVKQHPDVIQEIKKTIKDVLIANNWREFAGNNERPINDFTIRQTFDAIYRRAFIECIVSKDDILSLTNGQSISNQSFEQVLVAQEKQQTFDETLHYANDVTSNFENVFEKRQLTQAVTPIEALPTTNNQELLLKANKKFRSEDEAIMCKITYNKEKIKFLSAQYSLLELYLKHAFCDGMTGEDRIAFRTQSGYNLQNIKCDTTTKTPGELSVLFDKFNELLLNVEKSKEALEANGMSV